MHQLKGYFGVITEQYSHLLAREIIIAYDGDVTHQIMKAFTSLIEEKLESERENDNTIRKLYHILVECLQNINRHAEGLFEEGTESDFPGRGALLVSRTQKHYRIITANIIQNNLVPELKAFLEMINKLTHEELIELYKEKLMDGKLSAKGGAGLGFIDIKRKAGNKLEFLFIENDDETSFFLFNVKISRK
jgi:hypothetical protein